MTNTGRGNPRRDEQAAAPGRAATPGGARPERLVGARLLPRAEYRYGLVLLLLVATFVVLMVGSASRWVRPLTVALTGGTLVAALLAADARPRLRRAAAVASLAAFVLAVGGAALGERAGSGGAALLNAALVALAPVAIARSALRRRVIDIQAVMAALCIYVLLGMLWAFLYTAIGNLGSSAFFAQTANPTSADFLYFAFVTETTVGYGDLTAAGNLGRAGAVLNALLGQLYLVTVVALVVSRLTLREGRRPPAEP